MTKECQNDKMHNVKELLHRDAVMGFVIMIAVFGLALLYAGMAFAGIEHLWGFWTAFFIVGPSLMFRFTLPLSIGVFFCAKDVYGWEWYWALLLAAPGVILIVPGLMVGLWELVTSRR